MVFVRTAGMFQFEQTPKHVNVHFPRRSKERTTVTGGVYWLVILMMIVLQFALTLPSHMTTHSQATPPTSAMRMLKE
jgi:hypothetical protein